MIRLALAGPRYLGTALGVAAALFNLGVAAAYSYVAPAALASQERKQGRNRQIEPDPAPPSSAEKPPGSSR
jgi:Sec-independent protein secretion pathway component TatC